MKKLEKVKMLLDRKGGQEKTVQRFILFKESEFNTLVRLERQLVKQGVCGKGKIIAVMSELLLEELREDEK